MINSKHAGVNSSPEVPQNKKHDTLVTPHHSWAVQNFAVLETSISDPLSFFIPKQEMTAILNYTSSHHRNLLLIIIGKKRSCLYLISKKYCRHTAKPHRGNPSRPTDRETDTDKSLIRPFSYTRPTLTNVRPVLNP